MISRNDLEGEVWVVLKQGGDVYNRYEISNLGRVWDLKNGCEVSQVETGKPVYKYVNINMDSGKRKLRRIHNIMGWSFLGEPPTKYHTIDHIDQDKFNNVLSNLRWLSRGGQMRNRDCVATLPDGTPLMDYIEELGYDVNDKGVGAYLTSRIRKGDSFIEAIFNWANYLNPYPKPWKDIGNDKGVEFDGIWYPSLKALTKDKSKYSHERFLDLRKQGMSIEDALCHETDRSEAFRFYMDGFKMTPEEHCRRLNISLMRVRSVINKHGVSFEEAVKFPVERVIKHNINGVTKRNSDWYKHFNIDSGRAANSKLAKLGGDFRKLLEFYNIDTSDMKIYPCDGDVPQIDKPC